MDVFLWRLTVFAGTEAGSETAAAGGDAAWRDSRPGLPWGSCSLCGSPLVRGLQAPVRMRWWPAKSLASRRKPRAQERMGRPSDYSFPGLPFLSNRGKGLVSRV